MSDNLEDDIGDEEDEGDNVDDYVDNCYDKKYTNGNGCGKKTIYSQKHVRAVVANITRGRGKK